MACGLCAFRMEDEEINEQTCINSGWMPKPLGCSKLLSFAEVVKGCDARIKLVCI